MGGNQHDTDDAKSQDVGPIPQRKLILLLMAVLGVVHVLLLGILDNRIEPLWPALPSLLPLAMGFSIAGLLGGWLALGRAAIYWRVAGVWGGLLAEAIWLDAFGLAWRTIGYHRAEWVAMLTLLMAFSLAGGLLARQWGTQAIDPSGTRSPLRRWQFTIRHLLAAMLGVAIFLGTFPWLAGFEGWSWWLAVVFDRAVLAICLPSAAVTLSTLWLALAETHRARKGSGLVLGVVIVSCPPFLLACSSNVAFAIAITITILFQASCSLLILQVFRVAGYRLGSSPKASHSKTEGQASSY